MPDPGSPFENGVNLQPSHYSNGDVSFGWELMREADKIKTARIEIEPNKHMQERSWIQQACGGQGYQAICTYHKPAVPKPEAQDRKSELQAAADWWQTHSKNLIAGPVTVWPRPDGPA